MPTGIMRCLSFGFPPTQAVCQPALRRTAQGCSARTSLDLELDLQASLTRQSRLNDELQALRGLRQKLEDLKARGETDLPAGVLEDERFQRLLKQAEKQVRCPPRLRVCVEACVRRYPASPCPLTASCSPESRTGTPFLPLLQACFAQGVAERGAPPPATVQV